MEPFFIYLLKSTGVLALFFGCYQRFLKNETFFTANRLFLLSGLVLSVSLPFLVIVRTIWIDAQPVHEMVNEVTPISHVAFEQSLDWQQVFLIIYLAGVGLMLLHLLVQSLSLVKILLRGRTHKKNDLRIVETEAEITPCSFFNRIIYNPKKIERTELPTILDHEKCHVRQWHSIDVLLANLLTIFQWFNPLAWRYRSEVQQNLEYLADAQVLRTEHDKKKYQYLLLKSHVGDHIFSLVNPFFNSSISSIKKRIVMLNKERSSKRNLTKVGVVLPLLVVFVLLFNIKTEAKIKTVEQSGIPANDIARTYAITKETTDAQLNMLKKEIQNQKAALVITHLERNKSGNITKIALKYKVENRGHLSGNYNDRDGINTIHFGINEEGGIYITSTPKPGPDLKNGVSVSSKTNEDEGKNVMSLATYNDGKIQNEPPSVLIIHDSVSERSTAIGKVSGITFDVQDKKPLVLINGNETSHTVLNSLNPDQIKSVNVWKGQQALWKFGERAADGAIEIQTKKSKYKPLTYDKSKSGDFPHGINIRSSSYIPSPPPLYFIDGKETPQAIFNQLDPKNIRSINVLKGEKAIKKYGQKGKDGVMEITTKKSNWKVGYGKMPSNPENTSYFDFLVQIRKDNPNSDHIDLNNALILIDGKEVNKSKLKKIMVNDIESTSIIQSGETTIQKYGENGKNGVLLITTKKSRN